MIEFLHIRHFSLLLRKRPKELLPGQKITRKQLKTRIPSPEGWGPQLKEKAVFLIKID